MIVVHVKKDSEDAEFLKKYLKDRKLGKQVKLNISDDFEGPTTLVGTSGPYSGMQKVQSYLRGYFRE